MRTGESGSARGFRTVLIAAYGVFALSASARALVQIARQFEQAPVAYVLSLGAALTYVALTFALASRRLDPRWIWALIVVELAGVLGVGVFSLVYGDLLGDATVWSAFGAGYGYVPLVLPVIAGTSLLWEERSRRRLES